MRQPPFHLARRGAEGCAAGGGGAAFAEGLGVDRAVLHHALEVDLPAAQVLAALLVAHRDAVGQHAGPHRRADVHVVGECRGAAEAPQLGGHEHVGGVVGAQAAVGLGHAQAQQAGLAQVVVVGKGEAALAVPQRGAAGELVAAQFMRQGQQAALLGRQRGVADGGGEAQRGLLGHGWCLLEGRWMRSVRAVQWVSRGSRPAWPARRATGRRARRAARGRCARWPGQRPPSAP
jgi:hypothetical protein